MSSTIFGLAAVLIFLSLFRLPPGDRHLVKCRVYEMRQSENDLEVGGEIDGMPPGASRFVPYSELLKLPQVAFSVSNDLNFSGKTEIKGIPLDQLAQALGAHAGAKLVAAICYDGYQAVYPAAYLAAHHPVLVLKVNGRTQSNWPRSSHGGSLGPYLISQPAFTPSYKVLSHAEEQQIPFGVTRIVFREEKTVLGSIAPQGTFAADTTVMNGYRIAQQNCFRCHNMGAEGGQMAGRSWPTLAMWAATEPKYFSRYVKNPQSIDPKNRMPGNPGYDAATIDALRQYFASFDSAGKPGVSR